MRLDRSLRTPSIVQNRRENTVPKMGSRSVYDVCISLSTLSKRCPQWVARAHTVLAIGFFLSLTLPVEAKIYQYRGPDGRLIISNSPPPAGSEVTGIAREGSGPSMLTTAPTAIKLAPAPPQHRDQTSADRDAKPSKGKRQRARKRRARQTSRPVNTHKFGLLEIGSTKVAVERRIGPPEKRVRHGKKRRTILRHGQYISRAVKIESWHYPGNSRILSTRLVFYDDLLAEKDKAR